MKRRKPVSKPPLPWFYVHEASLWFRGGKPFIRIDGRVWRVQAKNLAEAEAFAEYVLRGLLDGYLVLPRGGPLVVADALVDNSIPFPTAKAAG